MQKFTFTAYPIRANIRHYYINIYPYHYKNNLYTPIEYIVLLIILQFYYHVRFYMLNKTY